jgi:predicted nucleic acid-binding Zn ribbon protein
MATRPIGDLLSQLIARRGYAREQSAAALENAWKEVAGEAFGRFTRAGAVRRGTLEVTVANNLLVQELGFQKTEFIERLQKLAPDAEVKNIRFRVGSIG